MANRDHRYGALRRRRFFPATKPSSRKQSDGFLRGERDEGIIAVVLRLQSYRVADETAVSLHYIHDNREAPDDRALIIITPLRPHTQRNHRVARPLYGNSIFSVMRRRHPDGDLRSER